MYGSNPRARNILRSIRQPIIKANSLDLGRALKPPQAVAAGHVATLAAVALVRMTTMA